MTIPNPDTVLALLQGGPFTDHTAEKVTFGSSANLTNTQITVVIDGTVQLPDTSAELVSWLALAVAASVREDKIPGIVNRPPLKKVTSRRLPAGHDAPDAITRYEYRFVEVSESPSTAQAKVHRTISVTLAVEQVTPGASSD